MTLAQFHPTPSAPPFPLSLFSQPGPASLSSKYKSFLLSFTCYLKARNSPAAEKAQARAEFPRASALSTLLSLAWSILCSRGRGEGPEGVAVGGDVAVSLQGGDREVCGIVCVCVCEELSRIRWRPVAEWYSGEEEARCLPSWLLSVLEDDAVRVWAWRWAGGQGYRACYCLANRTLEGHHSLRSPCPLSVKLGLQLCSDITSLPESSIRNQSKRRKPQSLGYFCSNVQRFAFLE